MLPGSYDISAQYAGDTFDGLRLTLTQTEGGSISADVQAAMTAQGYTPARADRIDGLSTREEVAVVNEGVKKASLLIPHAEDI